MGMYIISSGESATLADYLPCIPHDLSWSNVRCSMTVLTVWWCLFSIIKAMLCIGSGWSAVGWTGTLHLVTHTHTHAQTRSKYIKVAATIVTNHLFTAAKRPTIEGNCQTGGVCGAIVMVTTLDHAALYHRQDFDWPSLNLQPMSKDANIIKYQDPHGLLIERLQWLDRVWPAAPPWGKETKWRTGMNEGMNQSINQWINKSKIDHTTSIRFN